MKDSAHKAIAIVGIGAVMPDAPDAATFWQNIKSGRYSISDVPPERWDPELYYDPDRKAPDKSYSRIGGWVGDFHWDPLKWRLPIPPKVSAGMDLTQKWAIIATREALGDFGYPKRALNPERTAVILGNAMGGDMHLYSASRIFFPEYALELANAPSFASVPAELRGKIIEEMRAGIGKRFPIINEDTMPGELSNVIAGRIAALYDFHGPNYVADAACASAMAAISSAVEGLAENDYDAVVTGGIDANMSASTYVKFSKIGALSATGTRPYAKGADGFVMGEGAAVFVLKRLADAERDGDKIYAVIRGLGGSSDGKGKGITAPNPIGQTIAMRRAWENSGISPATVGMVEGHGTSTAVGDVVEVQCLNEVFGQNGLPKNSVALGSVKSNIGHLKGAAGAAGIFKTAMALNDKILPPSVNFNEPNPNIDFAASPFYVNTKLQDWQAAPQAVRRAGVSAFGFGGTNFHAVLEEYIPGRIKASETTHFASTELPVQAASATAAKMPLRGAMLIGGSSDSEVASRLRGILADAKNGQAPPPVLPSESDLRAPVRLALDYETADKLAAKAGKALKALETDNPGMWRVLRAKGVFLRRGPAPKVAFLFTGQGSQYVNMLREFRDAEPLVRDIFKEADEVMTPLLDKPLTEYIFVDKTDKAQVKQAEEGLRQTAITQPAVLAVDSALCGMLAAYGVEPDMVMGHSLGEYGALVACGAMQFADALRAVSARGSEMAKVSMKSDGTMAAVFGPVDKVEEIIAQVDGYVVIANINSNGQAVIGGETVAVAKAVKAVQAAGFTATPLSVSQAFHTEIVAPASEPMARYLETMNLQSPRIPVISNVTGEFYPTGSGFKPLMIDLLTRQISSAVQFVKGAETLHKAGARVFVEVGPKRALHGFIEDLYGKDEDVLALSTNHPRLGDSGSFNMALCGMYAAGLGNPQPSSVTSINLDRAEAKPGAVAMSVPVEPPANGAGAPESPSAPKSTTLPAPDKYSELGHLFADFLERGMEVYSGKKSSATPPMQQVATCVTGAALGLPGTTRVFDDENIAKILRGEQFIGSIPQELRQATVDKHITRVVKDSNGNGSFETINSTADVIKLAARAGAFDLSDEFGYPKDRLAALDTVTRLAIAAGIDALRDAGIPLMLHYKTTTTGTQLPDRWMLPNALRDDTGVIFASAFPGYNSYAQIMRDYYLDQARRERLRDLEDLHAKLAGHSQPDASALAELDKRIRTLSSEIEENEYVFDRRFLLRVLSMGHSQFAEYIGARGPNTQINGACASTPQAVSIANDWIAAGRCRRVIIISADDITADDTLEWFAAGFLASGAAATDDIVEDAAIPFDRRRHGMVIGMGGAALVVESKESADERGLLPIVDVLNAVTANSAFHATRLDVNHICNVMEGLVAQAESRWGIDRKEIASQTVFVSHETYTPARGGSASAEVNALRQVFGEVADQIVIANTKGFTGHAMATGIEDVVAIKTLETGIVPPVANHKEVDPDLGVLNLSNGGNYPVRYALRLGAGFGSQIAMSLTRWVPTPDGQRRAPQKLGFDYRIYDRARWQAWLKKVSGDDMAEVQVERRTLRLTDHGPAAQFSKPGVTEAAPLPVPPPVAPAPTPAAVAKSAAPSTPSVSVEIKAPLPPASAPAADGVQTKVLEIIAEKTGYPPDMLDMELDLEADLGIDTVKQAEMFAAIREEYDIPRDDNLQLRDFPTLKHTVQFVYDRRPDLQAQAVAPAVQEATPAAGDELDTVKDKVLAIIAEKTGYPPDMLDPDLDLEADLGIDTVKQAEMFAAIREEYDIPRDDNLQLRDFPTLAHTFQFVYDRRPDLLAARTQRTPAPETAQSTAPDMPPQPPATVAPASNAVQEKVLALIAEKTGYPPEMLDLDLDLEADLGIDTVKQAEMFAAIREEYDIPRDDNLQLRDFPTLAHTIQFVFNNRPDLKPIAPVPGNGAPAAVAATAPESAAIPQTDDAVRNKVLDIIADKTGYPPEMLDLDLDLEADLGIDTVKQAEMFAAIREEYDIPRDDNLQLRDFPTLAHTIQFVYDGRPDLQQAATPAVAQSDTVAGVAAEAAGDPVQEKVLEIIAEKTGYPSEMLDLDLDLEADLGIDTVKQAEMFASIREAYDIPRDENLQLRDFPTLAHTIQFVYDNRPDLKTESAAQAGITPPSDARATNVDSPAASVPAAATEAPAIAADMEAANQVPRRTPVPQLRPSLEFCKSTSVSLGAESRVLILSDSGGVGKSLVSRLEKRGVQTLVVDDTPSAEEITERIATWQKDGAIQGVYWLPALNPDSALADMKLSDWRAATHQTVKLLYTTMRALYEQVGGAGTFLVSATRLGGQHGYDADGALNPLGGAVSGLTKTFKREKPEALVKVVDFGQTRKTAALAEMLIAETLSDSGAVEIGYKHERRWTIGLEEQPVSETKTALELNKDSVFVITGAAGSIVSAITSDLATASGGTFHLLDLTPKPDPNDADLQKFVTEKENLKRDIFQRLKESGQKATPVMVEKELARLERLQAALNAIQAVERAGGTVHYHCVNLLDGKAMKKVMQAIRKTSGRIDVLLHAGGLEISHLLPDKQPQEFDLVFDVKADGWFNLISNLGDMPLASAVVFSSIAGRFGNAGQTDYSAANDLLCKSVSAFKTIRPDTIGVAIDWTAWGGIGMAVRGSIPTVMKAAGIDMLPPEAGIPIVRRELTLGATNKEVVIAGSLGMMLGEFDDSGGLELSKGSRLGEQPVGNRIMTGKVRNMGLYSGLTVETTLDPEQQPFLHDHQISGTPVLPGVMGLEAMVEAAMVLFPDLHVEAVDNVAFMAPFKFYRNQPRTVTVQATFSGKDDTVFANCSLIGERTLHGKTEPEVTTHFKARVKLSPTAPASKKMKVPAAAKSKQVVAEDIYRIYFHGPAYQVLEKSWRSGKKLVGRFASKLPANHLPASVESVSAPRLVELCFQTAGLLEMGEQARMGLPFGIDAIAVLRQPNESEGKLFAVVTPKADGSFDANVLDDKGNVYLVLQGYRTMELPNPISAELLEPLKAIV